MKSGLLILVLLLVGNLTIAVAAEANPDIPLSLRNNMFFTESLRQANLARLAFDGGDYEASREYSEEAIRYSDLSDEYVRMRLKMWETDTAITAAARRLEYAVSINAPSRFPVEYNQAQTAYSEARSFRQEEIWDSAIDAANRVLAALAYIDRSGTSFVEGTLPAQYTVQTWESVKDCLWNIAGRPWAYNDPFQWRLLYEANKARLSEVDNPDLILPGMVLDIPSIRGETRQGMWSANTSYSPLQ